LAHEADTDISFEMVPDMEAPDLEDPKEAKARKGAEDYIKKKLIEDEVKKEHGIDDEAAKKTAAIPPSFPQSVFLLGSRVIECEQFKLSNEEARVMADHLTVIFGKVDSRIFSAIVIVIIVIGKVVGCWTAIKEKISRIKEGKKNEVQE
jgi:hypothetical protein